MRDFLKKYLQNVGIVFGFIFGTLALIFGVTWGFISLVELFGLGTGGLAFIVIVVLILGAVITIIDMND